ncbi:hypothetical protein PV703_21760 [Streptomyces sp. ME01-24h]|nr:hypothetical protein [Streptomyces sp. ME01-24h]
MHGHRRPYSAAVTAGLLVELLGGYGSPDSPAAARSAPSAAASFGARAPAAKAEPPVTGVLDDHRHVARRTATGQRPRMVQRCTDRTRRVRHSSSNGTGRRRSTRSSYPTEHDKDRRKVPHGTEPYTRVVSAERWCVELDDVGGVSHPGRRLVHGRLRHVRQGPGLGRGHSDVLHTRQGRLPTTARGVRAGHG